MKLELGFDFLLPLREQPVDGHLRRLGRRVIVRARRFREQAASVMLRDDAPGVYVYHQRFTIEGHTYVRKGFIALIELTRFGEGPVLAHERTLAGPKADRLELMRACQAHLELVFGMFSDPDRTWERIVDPVRGEPVLTADFEGVDHTLWRVHDPAALQALQVHLRPRSIYIADGHHRYETMCAFRQELEAAGNPNAKFGMIYLSNLDDPGLVVLPTPSSPVMPPPSSPPSRVTPPAGVGVSRTQTTTRRSLERRAYRPPPATACAPNSPNAAAEPATRAMP